MNGPTARRETAATHRRTFASLGSLGAEIAAPMAAAVRVPRGDDLRDRSHFELRAPQAHQHRLRLARAERHEEGGVSDRPSRRATRETRPRRVVTHRQRIDRHSRPTAGISDPNAPDFCQIVSASLGRRTCSNVLSNSCFTRSADSRPRYGALASIARRVAGSMSNPNRAANRMPRSARRPVLAHASVRVAHRAHDPRVQVALAAERVAQLVAPGRIGDRVDREVASRQVVVERHAEFDDRVAPVRLHVAAERRHLVHRAFAIEHANRSELDADRNRPARTKYLAHFVRGRRRRQIPVEVRFAEQRVAHGAAHAPRLESRRLEAVRDVKDGGRRMKTGHCGGVGSARNERWRIAAPVGPVKVCPVQLVPGPVDIFCRRIHVRGSSH